MRPTPIPIPLVAVAVLLVLPQLVHVFLWSIARLGVRPPLPWMRAHEQQLLLHSGQLRPGWVAQVVWAYGELVPPAPYAKMFYRPSRQLMRRLLR